MVVEADKTEHKGHGLTFTVGRGTEIGIEFRFSSIFAIDYFAQLSLPCKLYRDSSSGDSSRRSMAILLGFGAN